MKECKGTFSSSCMCQAQLGPQKLQPGASK